MKDLIKQYLDHGMSRRQLMTGLSALGMSTVAAKVGGAIARDLRARRGRRRRAAMREMKGTGGALFVQQLKAAGVEHIFFNPSTGDYPIFDALVDEPAIQLIKGIHEGAVVAMADGYARASGKTGVVIVANIGLPNAMTQMVNSWKDQIPLLVAVASVEQDALGRDLFQEPDHCEVMTQPITKWYWPAKTTALDPGNRPPRHEVRLDARRAARCSCRCRPTRCARKRTPPSGTRPSSTCRCASGPTRTISRRPRACCSRPRTR